MDTSSRSDRPRCPRHNLALNPQGECLLCRRQNAGSVPPAGSVDIVDASGTASRPLTLLMHSVPPSRTATHVISGVLVLGMLLAVGFAWRTYQAGVASAMLATSEPARFNAGRGVPKAAPPTPHKPNAEAAMPKRPAAVVVGPATDPNTARPAVDPTVAQPPQPIAPIQAMPSSEDQRHAEIMAAIADRERARAASLLTITMYSTSWCGACKSAREYMQAHAIAFTDHDVESDAEARVRQLELNPAGSVPTIDIDGDEVMVGFSGQHLDDAIARSVKKRTGS